MTETAKQAETGRAEYEASLRLKPNYHDGSPRKSWEQLDDFARSTWVPARAQGKAGA